MVTTTVTSTGRPVFYSVKQAACILCVEPHVISRAIRLGTLRTRRRNGRLVIPANAVIRLLGQPRTDDGARTFGGAT